MKLAIAGAVCTIAVVISIVAAAAAVASSIFGSGSQPSTAAISDIPSDYLALYEQAAATCPGLNWTILAAIGKIETDHGRSTLPGVHSGANAAGAEVISRSLAL